MYLVCPDSEQDNSLSTLSNTYIYKDVQRYPVLISRDVDYIGPLIDVLASVCEINTSLQNNTTVIHNLP